MNRLAGSVTHEGESRRIMQVVVANDHAGYREGVARLIDDHPDLEVVALAADGPEALDRIVALQPDVALLDVRMPGHTGIEVCRRLRESGGAPHTRIVLITGIPDPALSAQADAAGAAALIGKETPPQEICAHLLAARTGDA
jgi:two-component system, NarL family, nitrate/nitrite response regulator NarL